MNSLRSLISAVPAGRRLVDRFVAGGCADGTTAAVATVERLDAVGLHALVELVAEEPRDAAAAERAVQLGLSLLDEVHAAGFAPRSEMLVRLAALGARFDGRLALDNAWRLCAAAEQCDTALTLDLGEYAGLAVLDELRHTWPAIGVVLRAHPARSEKTARALAVPGSRVRLAQAEQGAAHDNDLAYVRCANALLEGDGSPAFATADARLHRIIRERAKWYGRKQDDYEIQLPAGADGTALAAEGETVRVHVPFHEPDNGTARRALVSRS
ncbi:proline dehydrogenase [Amycolatopsis sp. H20-H5]|uniref:proline dehydrogenase n=1 Tax=Amycolatopsis sp. H20-H5 TaxID=3046309 RepID=UPI002DB7AF4F|nr:proline dehydrogenase [Amycolatopsis sp. H20-H5]MEC3975352.1 proline dehydrogenase [Amycolatopsis sp. H20-H5]